MTGLHWCGPQAGEGHHDFSFGKGFGVCWAHAKVWTEGGQQPLPPTWGRVVGLVWAALAAEAVGGQLPRWLPAWERGHGAC